MAVRASNPLDMAKAMLLVPLAFILALATRRWCRQDPQLFGIRAVPLKPRCRLAYVARSLFGRRGRV